MSYAKSLCAQYIGVPWVSGGIKPETGWDCWGCARFIAVKHGGKHWPSLLTEHLTYDGSVKSAIVNSRKVFHAWRKLENIKPFDLVCFATVKSLKMKEPLIFHVGVAVSRYEMVHAISYNGDSGGGTRIQRFDTPEWGACLYGGMEYVG